MDRPYDGSRNIKIEEIIHPDSHKVHEGGGKIILEWHSIGK